MLASFKHPNIVQVYEFGNYAGQAYFSLEYVDGGTLISQFLEAGLVDDMLLTSVPVLLGSGRPLFHRIGRSTPLRLVGTEEFPSGMLNRRYERVEGA